MRNSIRIHFLGNHFVCFYRLNESSMMFDIGASGDQPERQISCTKAELRATITGGANSIPIEIEGDHTIQVFPNTRTMEGS